MLNARKARRRFATPCQPAKTALPILSFIGAANMVAFEQGSAWG